MKDRPGTRSNLKCREEGKAISDSPLRSIQGKVTRNTLTKFPACQRRDPAKHEAKEKKVQGCSEFGRGPQRRASATEEKRWKKTQEESENQKSLAWIKGVDNQRRKGTLVVRMVLPPFSESRGGDYLSKKMTGLGLSNSPWGKGHLTRTKQSKKGTGAEGWGGEESYGKNHAFPETHGEFHSRLFFKAVRAWTMERPARTATRSTIKKKKVS